MDAIITLIGFFVGLAIFLFIMNRITAIVYNCSSVAITFFICWGIGIVLAWIAWKIAIIIGIIALVIWGLSKIFGTKNSSPKSDEAQNGEKESKGE
jgi:ABC-type multidrug transport system fused ATPase/permease subunit